MYIISQPEDRLLEKIQNNLEKSEYNKFFFSVAYAKMSGINLLKKHIDNFKSLGGDVIAVVGIDQKNTSIEALQTLLSCCNSVYVFHCEDLSQTFHPKFYFFDQEGKRADLVVSSGNLTNGGLLNNFEVGFGSELNYNSESDKKIIERTKGIIDSYTNNPDLCKPLNENFLQQLIERGYIISEDKQKISLVTEGRAELKGERLFGRSEGMLRQRPIASVASKEEIPVTVNEEEVLDEAEEAEVELNAGFWKKLSNYDVSTTSSPGQIIIPKGFKGFFPPFINHEITSSGAEQEESFMNVKFIKPNGDEIVANNARAIFYQPAPNHPRPNSELRFTFLNHDIFDTLKKDDILVFNKTSNSQTYFTIKHIKPNMPQYAQYNGRFDEI